MSSSSTLSDFRLREESLRRLDAELNAQKEVVVARAEEIVRQQAERLARKDENNTHYQRYSQQHGGALGEEEFMDETSGVRGRYENSRSRPSSAASRAHTRPVSAATQEGRRRSSAIHVPSNAASASAASSAAASTTAQRASSSSSFVDRRSSFTPSNLTAQAARAQARQSMRQQRGYEPTDDADALSADADNDEYATGGEGGGGGDTGRSGGMDADDASLVADGLLPSASLGSAATIRFLKARVRALHSSVSELSGSLKQRDSTIVELKKTVESSVASRDKMMRARDTMEKQCQTLQKQLDEVTQKSIQQQTEVATLRRDVSQAEKRRKEAESEARSKDAKLNRALADLDRTKERLAQSRSKGTSGSGVGGGSDETAKELASLRVQTKKLLQQRSDLLAGFKKQAKLIELLKRQKMHVEMAKLLQFTEEEFARSLETGDV